MNGRLQITTISSLQQLAVAFIDAIRTAESEFDEVGACGQLAGLLGQHQFLGVLVRQASGHTAQGHDHGRLADRFPQVVLELRLQLARQFRQVDQATTQSFAQEGRLRDDPFDFGRYRQHE
jgi:hypothetical protein